MPRKIVTRKREDISKIKESVQKEQDAIEKSLPPIVRDTGGSISNLPIKSKYFKNWLADVRENINPLIGKKYLQAAPEHSTEDKMINDQTVDDVSKEFIDVLKKGASAFSADNDTSPEMEKLRKSPKKDKKFEEKFMDITLIENITKKWASKEEKDIKKRAEEQMKAYHDDPTYKTDIDIEKVITNYKSMLLIQAEAKKKLLGK